MTTAATLEPAAPPRRGCPARPAFRVDWDAAGAGWWDRPDRPGAVPYCLLTAVTPGAVEFVADSPFGWFADLSVRVGESAPLPAAPGWRVHVAAVWSVLADPLLRSADCWLSYDGTPPPARPVNRCPF